MSDSPTFDVDRHQLGRLLEAILFATAEPLTLKSLAARLPEGSDVKAVLQDLRERYAGRGVELREVDGAWAFRTAVDLAPQLAIEREETRRLSRAGLETLSIIAYHQPVTRAEIEDIRGVALSKGTLDLLVEAGWVQPRGRRQTPGRPLTWGTTRAFLDHFGLESLRDLPGVEDLRAAGLLESRSSLVAYGARAGEDEPLVDTEDDEESRRQMTLPMLDLDEEGDSSSQE